MRPSFHPRLVNGPFEDPGLFIPFLYEKRALLFDLGDIHNLSTRDILKISHVFVTHTHVDHFIGFDRLIRLLLGREKTLNLYGPEGFIKNVEGKLSGYAWNLVANYQNRFVINVSEVDKNTITTKQYRCKDGFISKPNRSSKAFYKILLQEPSFTVSAIILDHRIPSLGVKITERFHVNINRESVLSMGLEIGPWLNAFKLALFNNQDPESLFKIHGGPENNVLADYKLGELAERIAIISPGQKMAYIVDSVYREPSINEVIRFVSGVDHLYVEAAFLDEHRDIAQEKYHLTARQAGTIAARARVKQFTLFHFSPRYTGRGHLLEAEAKKAYDAAISSADNEAHLYFK